MDKELSLDCYFQCLNLMSTAWGSDKEGLGVEPLPADRRQHSALLIGFHFPHFPRQNGFFQIIINSFLHS